MNRRGFWRMRLSATLGMLVLMVSVSAVLLAGCTKAADAPVSGPWPSEVENVEPFAGYTAALAMPGAEPLVFAGGQLLSLGQEGFESRGSFSEDYELGGVRAGVSGEPRLDGAQVLGSKAVFTFRGFDSTSDGEGVAEAQEYGELLLIDPHDPSNRETVYRVGGHIDSVQAFESVEASTQAIMFQWSPATAETRVVSLLVRGTDGAWVEKWSSDTYEQSDPFTILGYGLTASSSGLDAAAFVVGDSDGEVSGPHALAALSIGLDGTVKEVETETPGSDEVERIDYLCDYSTDEAREVAFRVRDMDGREGLLLSESAGGSMRTLWVDSGTPLLVLDGASGAAAALVGPSDGVGPLKTVALDDGTSTEISQDSDATWAGWLSRGSDGTRCVALVGRAPAADGSVKWSASELRYTELGGTIEMIPLIESWDTPDQSWYITSVDELPVGDAGRPSHAVVGLRAADEGAVATVAVE